MAGGGAVALSAAAKPHVHVDLRKKREKEDLALSILGTAEVVNVSPTRTAYYLLTHLARVLLLLLLLLLLCDTR